MKWIAFGVIFGVVGITQAQSGLDEAASRAALEKAVTFFRTHVSANGSYLWQYSADLSLREGEGKAGATTGWVQPPGTPTVGMAYLRAYERTGERYLLDAAVETGQALVMGQLRSGGWDYRIEFDPKDRAAYTYRKPPAGDVGLNITTLDDDTTQAALKFLLRLDKALDFKNEAIHECVGYALDALLEAQYPNGAWPQRFVAPPDPAQYPAIPASYPDAWSREFTKPNYMGYYTFNDNTINDTIELMLDAWECYGDTRYRDAALKAGEFIVLAQMPDPQPAWAQQYDPEMHPAWARKFEPPAVTGGESQSVIQTLIVLAHRTGEMRFLEPIPRAIAYLRSSLLPDGRLARFYELKTNTPLFFTKDYQITYDGSDVPTHYAFFSGSRLDTLEASYTRVEDGGPPDLPASPKDPATIEVAAKAAIESMDARGAWLSNSTLRTADDPPAGTKSITTRDFVDGVDALSAYIELLRH